MSVETWLPIIDAETCTGCGDCVDVCPTNALALQDEAASEAFERSEAISDTVSTSRSQPELVENLYTAHGLSDAEIAEIADIEKSRVVLLRRQAARRSLIGE